MVTNPIGHDFCSILTINEIIINLEMTEYILIFLGVAHVCAGAGTPLLSRLCGAINILSTKLDATVASVSVYGE